MARVLTAILLLLTGCGAASGDSGGVTGTASGGMTGTASGGVTDSESVSAAVTDSATESVTETLTASGTDLEIVCFQAGKADAFLLITPESAVLIDCGEKGFGKTILAELEARNIAKLDLMIITHFDQDHVGGAARIINNFPVERILQSNSPKDSEEYEKYIKAVKNASIEPETVRENLSFALDGVAYTVNPPKKTKYNSDSSNNSSLIVSVTNGANRLLFTGDAEDERLEEFLTLDWGTFDFLKMPHHGNWHEPLPLLLETTAPRYAVITSSDEEPEDAETLELLESSGVETFLTRNGQVIVRSDGENISVAYA
ncbi:MAG: MBL fold metallo-hydrolase [Oscillibacter sp.]|nr:MBL fold metallo-hydrolase [Oscillibacter sp.]